MSVSLTGIWHGLYSYPSDLEPVYFVATLISFGTGFSGTTHEAIEGRSGARLQVFATVDGSFANPDVQFLKRYDAASHWTHAVNYAGVLSADGTEIEGRWRISGDWSGSFLMIRGARVSETVIRRAFAPV
jgi:hypothetical protein